MVIVVPIYEEEITGVYYNTAAVIDADGAYLGKYRKIHIPHVAPGLLGKVLFQARQPRLSGLRDGVWQVGVYICYDRHFPEGARVLGLNGAEIVFNPSATVAGLSRISLEARAAGPRRRERVLRRRHQPPRLEEPWHIGEFYGQSYFCDPRGKFLAEGSATRRDRRRRHGPRHDPKSATPGNSSAIAGRRRTARSQRCKNPVVRMVIRVLMVLA